MITLPKLYIIVSMLLTIIFIPAKYEKKSKNYYNRRTVYMYLDTVTEKHIIPVGMDRSPNYIKRYKNNYYMYYADSFDICGFEYKNLSKIEFNKRYNYKITVLFENKGSIKTIKEIIEKKYGNNRLEFNNYFPIKNLKKDGGSFYISKGNIDTIILVRKDVYPKCCHEQFIMIKTIYKYKYYNDRNSIGDLIETITEYYTPKDTTVARIDSLILFKNHK